MLSGSRKDAESFPHAPWRSTRRVTVGRAKRQSAAISHICLVHHVASGLSQPLRHGLRDFPHAAQGVVDAPVVPVAEHHARVDQGRLIGQHRAPAVALHVDEVQQLGVLDVFPGHVSRVGGQKAGQGEAGHRVLGKLCAWRGQY